jgi:hypothetical protein
MTNAADRWFTPGRPQHPDFLVISDIILAADAASNGTGFEEYVSRYSTISLRRLSSIAMDEASTLRSTYPDAPPQSLAEAMWAMGFAAGVRVSRGQEPPQEAEVREDPEKVMYAGVDPNSVRYTARQRVMRILNPNAARTQDATILAGCWLDAVMVGLRFDERRNVFFAGDSD